MHLSGKQCLLVKQRHHAIRLEHISTQVRCRRPFILFRSHIAAERRLECLSIAGLQCPSIGIGTAVEHSRQFLYPLRNADVSNSQFPQRMIDIGKKPVRDVLGDRLESAIAIPEAVKEKKQVQRNHLEATERRVGNTPFGIKNRLPRRCHDLPVQTINDVAVSCLSSIEKASKHFCVYLAVSRPSWSGCIETEAEIPKSLPNTGDRHRFDLGMSLQSQDMKTRRFFRSAYIVLAAGSALMLTGCVSDALNPSQTLVQGYVPDEQALELVPVGSSREQVLLALGTPSTSATFDNEVFYYISQTRVRRAAFMKPKLVDQRILAVYFGEEERVTNIANYGLQDGKIFDFLSKTTPTGGKDTTFISQLLSGAGKALPKLPGSRGG